MASDVKLTANIGHRAMPRKIADVSALPNTMRQRPTFASFVPA
jgi:hypothetical protein